METVRPEQLRAVRLLKHKRIVECAYHNSPFCREKFDRAGVVPGGLRELDDHKKLPLAESGVVGRAG